MREEPRQSLPPWTGYLIGPIFLGVAFWLLWGSPGLDLPEGKAQRVDPSLLSTAARRRILEDPPTIHIDGFDRTCMDCHRLFPPREVEPAQLLQHEHIVLDHGINDRCRNCHYELDRDRLVLRGGRIIGYDAVVELCAKCHGPTYRDWQRGAHGRTNGYWDAQRGEMVRLTCTQCHDPHLPRVPAMDPLTPLPAPRTLRMGEPRSAGPAEREEMGDPLWRGVESSRPAGAQGTEVPLK
jgi:hypothetical protein